MFHPGDMQIARDLDGVISGEHGIGITKLEFLTDDELANFTAYKQRVDPEGRFNKGKLLRDSALKADLTNAYTPSFGLMGHESLIMTHKERALAEMARVLKPGGRLLVLEFSKVAAPLAKAYDWYSFNVLPRLGRWVAGDAESYRYLAESIRVHPDQETLKAMMKNAGFGHVDVHNLSAGVVALHVGIKC